VKKLFNILQYWIKNHFGFSYREANGFMVIIFLMLLLLLAPIFFDFLTTKQNSTSEKDRIILDSILAVTDFQSDSLSYKSPKREYAKKDNTKNDKKSTLFDFDPNTCTKSDFIALGVYSNIAERIEKYRSKGGKFRKAEDLKKIYGFPEYLFQKLEPFIKIETNQVATFDNQVSKKELIKNFKEYEKTEFQRIDINTADTAQLMKIKGIGVKLSARIIKYRSMLGGFVSPKQFSDIYGFDSVLVDLIKKNTFIGNKIDKILINISDYQILKSHPYIGYTNAKIIVAYRKTHSKIDHINQIKLIDISEEKKEYLDKYLEY